MALVVLSQVITASLSLLTSFLLARWTQKAELGEFFFYNGASTAVSGLIAAPFGMWLTRSQNLDEALTQAIKRTWLWLCIAISALAAVIMSIDSNEMLALSTLNCALLIGIALFTFSWNSNGYTILFSIGMVLPVLLRFATLLGVVIFSSLATSLEILLLSVLSAFASLLFLFIVDKTNHGQATPDMSHLFKTDDFLKHLKMGKHIIGFMLLSSSIYTVYQFADKLIAKNVIGYAGTADITLIMQWSYLVTTMALQPFIALAYPRILQASADRALQIIRKFVALFGALTIIGAIPFAACKEIIREFAPPYYAESVGVLWIGVLAGGFFMTGQVLSTWFSRSGNERAYLSTIVIPTLIGVTTMYIGASAFGFIGIVCGHLLFSITYVTSCALGIKRSRGQNRY